MKNIFFTFAVILLNISDLDAQDTRTVRFAFAVQPATTWIKPEGEILEKESNGFGFSYGIITDIMIANNENYAFSSGILINSQNSTVLNSQYHDGTTTAADTSSLLAEFAQSSEKYKLQYLDIPLTLKLKTNEIGYLTYFGQFGLDLSFNLKSRRDIEYQFEDGPLLRADDEDVQSDIGLLRTALQVGLGAEYNIAGNTSIMAALVWNNGLTNVFSKNNLKEEDGKPVISSNNRLQEGGKVKAINNYFGLTLGVFF